MVRLSLFGLVCAGAALLAVDFSSHTSSADPDSHVSNVLAVQRAMEQARFHLLQKGDAYKAVRILEEHLPRINGNGIYLQLLRDAYRAHIRELCLAKREDEATKFLERLSVLEPDAIHDPSLRREVAPSAKTASKPSEKAPPTPRKIFALSRIVSGLTGGLKPTKAAGPASPPANDHATVRAKIEDDPFDTAYRRAPKIDTDRVLQAKNYLELAEQQYHPKKNYLGALVLYEKVHQLDPGTATGCRQRWAYCKLYRVVDQLKQTNLDGIALGNMNQELRLTMEMEPTLGQTCRGYMKEIDRRMLAARPAGNLSPALPFIRHLAADRQGWKISETAHFRIHHRLSADQAEKVGRTAEQSRLEISRKWLGIDGEDWGHKCEIYLYANGQEYARANQVSAATPGHSRIDTDPTTGRVVRRQLNFRCDNPEMLSVTMPHEITHVVLAGQFGKHHLPRWADEGMAVLAEPRFKIDQYLRHLGAGHGAKRPFTARDLFQLPDWPASSQISAFYAQSVVLADFFVRQRGPQTFVRFLRDGLDSGFEPALRKHYGYADFNDLQQRYQAQMLAEMSRISPALAGR